MTPPTICQRIDEDDVSDRDDQLLRDGLADAFASAPAGALLRQRRWLKRRPSWRWVVRDDADGIAAHLAVHELLLGTASGDLAAIGIAEVYVHPQHRGRGLVRAMLVDCHAHARACGLHWSALFGSPRVYGSSGYLPRANPLIIDAGEPATHNSFQACPLAIDAAWPSGVIDLRGPTW